MAEAIVRLVRLNKHGEPVKEWKKLAQIVTKVWCELHNKNKKDKEFCQGEDGLDWLTTKHAEIVHIFEASSLNPATLRKNMCVLADVYMNIGDTFDLEMWRSYRTMGLKYLQAEVAAKAPGAPITERNKKNGILPEEIDLVYARHLANDPAVSMDKAATCYKKLGVAKGTIIRWSLQAAAMISTEKEFHHRNGNYENMRWYDGPDCQIPDDQNAYHSNRDGKGNDAMICAKYKTVKNHDPSGHVTYGTWTLPVPDNVAADIQRWHEASPNKDYLFVTKKGEPMNSDTYGAFMRSICIHGKICGHPTAEARSRRVLQNQCGRADWCGSMGCGGSRQSEARTPSCHAWNVHMRWSQNKSRTSRLRKPSSL